jgi:hypothetical protein
METSIQARSLSAVGALLRGNCDDGKAEAGRADVFFFGISEA